MSAAAIGSMGLSMNVSTSFLVASLLAFVGMGLLSFAMDRHHGDMTGRRDGPGAGTRRAAQAAGALLLAVCAGACLRGGGASVGVVLGLGAWSVGALGVATALSLAPRRLPLLAATALAVAGGLLTTS